MNIEKKIEQIRLQPEHIRLRWVWGSVIVSMLLIFAVWLLSITMMFKNEKGNPSQNTSLLPDDLIPQNNDIPAKSTSLKDYTGDKPLTINAEGVIYPQKNIPEKTNNDPGTSSMELTNQSNSYADLGETSVQ